MKRTFLFFGAVGLTACAQVLGLDEYSESSGSSASSEATTGVGGGSVASSSVTGGGSTATGATTTSSSSGTGGAPPTYRAKAVTGGAEHTCALLEDARIVCWGNNDNGQLGDGTFKSSDTPVLVQGIDNAASVDAGDLHTCALLTTGEVRCWGNNEHGELGLVGADKNSPVTPVGLPAVVAGVTAGGTHSCAFVMDGRAYCWGGNASGQLGRNSLGGSPNVALVDTLMAVKSLSAGGKHTCAAADPQTVFCWGDNASKQTGGPSSNDVKPRGVYFVGSPGPLHTGAPVEASSDSTCNRMGTPWCWGQRTANKQTTDQGSAISTQLTNVVQLAGGGQNFCARYQNGAVACWGANDDGQLGNGATGAPSITEVVVSGVSDAVGIGLGSRHGCAVVMTSGEPGVLCWGANDSGQLGDGTKTPSSVPVPVQYLP